MTIQLSKDDLAIIRHAGGELDGAGVAQLEVAVIARLQKQLDSGEIKQVTAPNVRAAATAELSAGK